MKRSTINSNTFLNIFKDKEDLLARLASSLTRNDYEIFKNNITSDDNNPKKFEYIIKMPNDNTIKLINTKTKEIKIFKLDK